MLISELLDVSVDDILRESDNKALMGMLNVIVLRVKNELERNIRKYTLEQIVGELNNSTGAYIDPRNIDDIEIIRPTFEEHGLSISNTGNIELSDEASDIESGQDEKEMRAKTQTDKVQKGAMQKVKTNSDKGGELEL